MTQVKAIPDGMRTVTPHLVCAGAAAAIEFYKKAFDAQELVRIDGTRGLLHACLQLGDSRVMLTDEFPEWGALGPKTLKGASVTINLYVEAADSVYARAISCGAKVRMPMEDTFWGDRYGVLEDPFGHSWAVASHIRDMAPEEIQAAADRMFAA